ncbi:branched-chain amino acid ABC transporter permease [Leisingera sp. ANG-M1]|uniref:branched-chain amino acid ABC transporter permease n=1 Tax=Leisingera sp. ANG-M1 TaxID=1577895 RepID=UPI00069192A7|nr:branched-chain amino acid ABC transporter permease [Leisingera sp. ANG-M1]
MRGISRNYVIAMVWAIAGVLTAFAGVLIGMDRVIDPLMGWYYVLPVFAAVILGGIGNPLGAVIGALLIGEAEELATLVLPTTYRQAVSFLIIALVLLQRQHGLLGKARITR